MNLIQQVINLPPSFGITGEAEEHRNELLIRASEFTSITTSAEQNSAVEVARDIRKLIAEVDATRMSITRPLNNAASAIKAVGDDYKAPLMQWLASIERLVTDFQAQESRRVAAAEEVRRLEYARLERDRETAEKAARLAAAAMTDENQLQAALAAESAARRLAEAAQAVVMAPMPSAAKAGGTSTRETMEFNVIDAARVYAVRPDLCSVEVRASAVKSFIVPKRGATESSPDTTTVPGLSLWYYMKTTVRKW